MDVAQHESLACPICEHGYTRRELTRHHLVPKSRKGRETVLLCRSCHRQIHALFTEKEIERCYSSLETLMGSPEMNAWMQFIRKRKPTAHLPARTSRRKRRR